MSAKGFDSPHLHHKRSVPHQAIEAEMSWNACDGGELVSTAHEVEGGDAGRRLPGAKHSLGNAACEQSETTNANDERFLAAA